MDKNSKYYTECPDEIIQEIKQINRKIDEQGYVLGKDAKKLLEFDRKYLICSFCHKTLKQQKIGFPIFIQNKRGTPVQVGYSNLCADCIMKDMGASMEITDEKQ